MVPWAGGCGEEGMTDEAQKRSFWHDGNVLYLGRGVRQVYTVVKTLSTVPIRIQTVKCYQYVNYTSIFKRKGFKRYCAI